MLYLILFILVKAFIHYHFEKKYIMAPCMNFPFLPPANPGFEVVTLLL